MGPTGKSGTGTILGWAAKPMSASVTAEMNDPLTARRQLLMKRRACVRWRPAERSGASRCGR
jgi:C4-dicarboxylate-specific signal transduction histidine kinase